MESLKHFRFFFVFIFLITLFLNCTKQVKNPVSKRHLNFQAGQMGHKPWDRFASYAPKINFYSATFTPLLRFDKYYHIYPGIFKDWNWNQKTNQYIFQIDKTLEFSEGRKIKPIDIEFALLKNYLSTETETNTNFLKEVYGIDKLKRGQKFVSGMCEGIKVLSEQQIAIKLNNPNPNFLYVLGDLIEPIAPIEDFNEDMFTFKDIPRGTGPYKIIWSDPKTSLVRLQRKIHDQSSVNYPITIDFYNHGTALENNINLATGAGTNGLKNNINYTTEHGHIPEGVQVIDFNHSNIYGKNKEFRRALSLVIDRKKIFQSYKNVKFTHELVPSLYYGRSGLKFQHNPTLAKKIIQDQFGSVGTPTKPLKSIFHGKVKNGKLPEYLHEIQLQLRSINVFIDFTPRDWTAFDPKDSDIILSVYGAVTTFVDPLAVFTQYMPGSPFELHMDKNDKEVLSLYTKAKNATERNERSRLVSALSRKFHAGFHQIPLEEHYPVFMYDSKINNIDIDDLFIVVDFSKVNLEN